MSSIPTAIIGGGFYGMLLAFRVLWLSGRFGGGKTATACILAARLLADGYVDRIVCNFPFALSSPPDPPLTRAAIILDEAWQFAALSSATVKYAAFLRKAGNFLILPSVHPVNARFAVFSAERVFNAYNAGLPVWVFRYTLARPGFRERGYSLVINPGRIFQLYDTDAVALDDGGIAMAMNATFATTPPPQPRGAHKTTPAQPQLPGLNEMSAELADSTSALNETLNAFTESIRRARRR